MARPLRIEYPGAVYHVMNRGLARQAQKRGHYYLIMYYGFVANSNILPFLLLGTTNQGGRVLEIIQD